MKPKMCEMKNALDRNNNKLNVEKTHKFNHTATEIILKKNRILKKKRAPVSSRNTIKWPNI